MRKLLIWLVPLVGLILLASLGWQVNTRLHHKQAVAERTKTLPPFAALSTTGDTLTRQTLQPRPSVLVFIDPDCDHCRQQVEQLRKHPELADKATLILLSAAPVATLRQFAHTHQLTQFPNIRLAHMDAKVAYETFGFTTTPDILIYRANGQLARHFRGQASPEAIARYL
ncbi:MAG: thioredoxin family protein [Cytophagales bacterium]|nr:MAG: thioredoxin family protein [Cytophagales bacterium]